VDSEYKDEMTIDIKYNSQAYVDLILNYSDAAKYVAVGRR
jgi:hypothetical protein